MNVDELYSLSVWIIDEYDHLSRNYTSLLAKLQHNAQQANKEPFETELNALLQYLKDMQFEQLSFQQIKILEKLSVLKYLGMEGSMFVESVIKTSDFDPATARDEVQKAVSSISNAHKRLQNYAVAIEELDLDPSDFDAEKNRITIRVGFQNNAAINHIVDWKNSAKNWHDIIRGLAMVAGESPEDTKVIGATKGSLILVLGGTAAVTTLLAVISKNITSIAKDVISVGIERENLRQKKMLSKGMAIELKKMETEKREEGYAQIIEAVKEQLGEGVDGDAMNALENSIKKLLTFGEKGGNIDFISPKEADQENEDDGDADAITKAALEAARKAILEYQGEREAVKLLEYETKDG